MLIANREKSPSVLSELRRERLPDRCGLQHSRFTRPHVQAADGPSAWSAGPVADNYLNQERFWMRQSVPEQMRSIPGTDSSRKTPDSLRRAQKGAYLYRPTGGGHPIDGQ